MNENLKKIIKFISLVVFIISLIINTLLLSKLLDFEETIRLNSQNNRIRLPVIKLKQINK